MPTMFEKAQEIAKAFGKVAQNQAAAVASAATAGLGAVVGATLGMTSQTNIGALGIAGVLGGASASGILTKAGRRDPLTDKDDHAQVQPDAAAAMKLEFDAIANGEGIREDIVVKGPLRFKNRDAGFSTIAIGAWQ